MNQLLSHRQLEYLFQVSNILNSTMEIDTVIDSILNEIITIIEGADSGILFLYDSEKDLLVAKSSYGFKTGEYIGLRPGESMTGMAFQAKKTLTFENRDSVIQSTSQLTKRNYEIMISSLPDLPCSTICSPILVKNICIGVITLDCLTMNKKFFREDIQLLEAITHQIAVAIEKTNLYKEKEKTISKLATLNNTIFTQNKLLTQSIDMHNKLSEIVLQGEKLESIIAYLHSFIGNPICLVDQFGELITDHQSMTIGMFTDTLQTFKKHLQENSFTQLTKAITIQKNDLIVTVFPIGSKSNILGFLLVIPNRKMNFIELTGIEHACTVISLQLLKEQELFAMEQDLKGQFIDELFSGRMSTELLQQAKHLLLVQERNYQVIIINFESLKNQLLSENHFKQLRKYFVQMAQVNYLKNRTDGIVVAKDYYLIVLVSYDKSQTRNNTIPVIEAKSKAYLEQLKNKYLNLHVSIVIGGLQPGLDKVYKSSQQALKCLQFMRNQQLQEKSILSYDQLGVKRLLLKNSEEELIDYVMEVLGPLLRFEQQHKNSEYLNTLLTFLEHNQKYKETASKLHIHLNTLSYRLKKIEEILGLNLNMNNHIHDIFLAVNIYNMFREKIQREVR